MTGNPGSPIPPVLLDPASVDRWGEAVAGHPGATVFHSAEWASVFAAAYGHRPTLVCSAGGADGRWAMPVSRVPRPFGKPLLVSMPYSDFAGPLAAPGLAAAAAAEAASAVGGVVEVRTGIDLAGTGRPSVYSTYRIALPCTEEEMLRRLPGRSVRYPIGKAERDGIEVRSGNEGDIRLFHGLMSLNRRRHGLPTPPGRFYLELYSRLIEPGGGLFLLAGPPGGPVLAASIFLWSGDWGFYKYSAGSRGPGAGNATHLLLWHGVREGIRRGCAVFDLGRASGKNAGLSEMKRRWCGEEVPLHYVMVSPDGRIEPVPEGGGVLAGLLRGLLPRMPAAVSRGVGQLAYRYFA